MSHTCLWKKYQLNPKLQHYQSRTVTMNTISKLAALAMTALLLMTVSTTAIPISAEIRVSFTSPCA